MSEAHSYSVQYVHATHRGPESVRLWPADLADRKALGKALRAAGVLPKGKGVQTSRIVSGGPHKHEIELTYTSGPEYLFAHNVILRRSDLWTVIGRGKADWHAARPGCSSSGGTLEAIGGTRTVYPDGIYGAPKEEAWSRSGYVADAAEGCHVYDAENADAAAFTSFVMGGPMLSSELSDDGVDAFGQAGVDAARGMLGRGGLEGEFACLAGLAVLQHEAGRKYGSLDRVGWSIYKRLLSEIGGVRFGTVRAGAVVWEDAVPEGWTSAG
jgi:hypothetical protein